MWVPDRTCIPGTPCVAWLNIGKAWPLEKQKKFLLSIHSDEFSGFLTWWNHERSASREIQSQVLVMINSSLSPARQIGLFISTREEMGSLGGGKVCAEVAYVVPNRRLCTGQRTLNRPHPHCPRPLAWHSCVKESRAVVLDLPSVNSHWFGDNEQLLLRCSWRSLWTCLFQ